jgi:hypothetical protein
VNSFAVNRTQVLVGATVLLLLCVIIYHIWADWGLITIHAKQEPLGKVIASMERQGHANIQTDMPGDTPVTMDVVKVHLTDALETLSVSTESRWRLLYFVAGDKATLKTGESTWFSGQRPDGWKLVSFPMDNVLQYVDDSDQPPLDPRLDVYTPRTPAPAPVQTFFAEAAQLTNAGFAFPEDWNPTVTRTPPSGIVDRVIPKLISAAHGKQDQLFFLSKNNRRAGPPADAATAGFQFDPDLFAARIQGEINRLPPDERAEAQSNFETEQAFRASLKDMTDDQRRAAWLAHLQDPAIQQAIANRMDANEARMNHDQRMQRMQNYVNRKMSIMGKL